jgi:hypothetical protein
MECDNVPKEQRGLKALVGHRRRIGEGSKKEWRGIRM